MHTKFSHTVNSRFNAIVQVLGESFAFEDLVNLTEACRGKALQIEQDQMPIAMTGYCIALQDVDLICTRTGLDEILVEAARLHEIAHLLLGHIPYLSNGSATPTYAVFHYNRDFKYALKRLHSGMYEASYENDAETMATLLLHCIDNAKTSLPRFAQHLYI